MCSIFIGGRMLEEYFEQIQELSIPELLELTRRIADELQLRYLEEAN